MGRDEAGGRGGFEKNPRWINAKISAPVRRDHPPRAFAGPNFDFLSRGPRKGLSTPPLLSPINPSIIMPPPIPRAGFQLPLRLSPSTARCFSSSSRCQILRPEHPDWIQVPQPAQADKPDRPTVKGTLPVPRDIVPLTDPLDPRRKNSPTFMAKTTPEPESKQPLADPRRDHRRRAAALRRHNLRTGIQLLDERQTVAAAAKAVRSARNQASREAALMRPARRDEVLTAPSVPIATRYLLGRAGAAVPKSSEDRLQARQHYDAALARQRDGKKRQLHDLYMQARTFITTEKHLAQEVDRAFGAEAPVRFGTKRGYSIWDTGAPDSIQTRLEAVDAPPGHAMDTSQTGIEYDRLKRVVEEMTGGRS
jgi:hypothetical protein